VTVHHGGVRADGNLALVRSPRYQTATLCHVGMRLHQRDKKVQRACPSSVEERRARNLPQAPALSPQLYPNEP
jgi:hypothetical protein